MNGKLTLGPLLFNWPAEDMRDFYFRVADEAPVDAVYLGEVVCAKRAGFFAPHLPQVVDRLARAGKEVVLSTPALVMDGGDIDLIRELAGRTDALLEANDVAAIALMDRRPHVVGPYINTYNEGTLGFLVEHGAVRVVLPVEMPATAIGAIAAFPGVALEVQVFGRLPLALSARCYHARFAGLSKDGCRFACDRDPDGLSVETLDGEPFLAVNGTQVLSSTYVELSGEMEKLSKAGISHFRLSPQVGDMVTVAESYRGLLQGLMDAGEAAHRIHLAVPGARFSNGYYFGLAGAAFVPRAADTRA